MELTFADFIALMNSLETESQNHTDVSEATGCEGCTGCDTVLNAALLAADKDEDDDDDDKQVVDSYDLSGEMYRDYIYPDETVFTIHDPLELVINEHGNHVVAAKDGNGYYVSPGWVAVHWQVYPGAETISFV